VDRYLNNIFEILKWDSDFFGFIVARLIPHRLTKSQLKYYLELLKDRNVALVYWACDQSDKNSQDAAKMFNGFLADNKMTYQIDFCEAFSDSLQETNTNICEYTNHLPDSALISLALQSGIFSRFKVDPKFSKEQYERLYTLWITNSVNNAMADIVFVAKHRGNIVGMVTARKKQDYGQIGLISVDEKMRGKNIGTDLVRKTQKWFISQGCKIAQVVTQGNNVAGCRLYEKCGYHLNKLEHVYHFWL
jgi:dTDP-4-amino-4,6-dideoxy-D-galactose acyltransferase